MPSSALIFFGIVALVFLIGVLIFVPKWQVEWSTKSESHATRSNTFEIQKERLKLEDEARKTLAQIIGGLLVLVGLVITYNTYQISVQKQDLDRESQVTDRFSKAVTHLGDDKLAVRIGGLFELERIAQDSEKDNLTVKQVLYTYLHSNFSVKNNPASTTIPLIEPRENSNGLAIYDYTADSELQTILNIIQRLAAERERFDMRQLELSNKSLARANYEFANFSSSNLSGAIFYGSNFQGAKFKGATLTGATTDLKEWEEIGRSVAKLVTPEAAKVNFTNSDFSGASILSGDFAEAIFVGSKFRKSDLSKSSFRETKMLDAQFDYATAVEAVFKGADLSRANFGMANLSGAVFDQANLYLTNFAGADLTNAKRLKFEQLKGAIIDENTKLPQDMLPHREELLSLSIANRQKLQEEVLKQVSGMVIE